MKLQATNLRPASLKLKLARTKFLIEKFKDKKFAKRVNLGWFFENGTFKIRGKRSVHNCGAVGCVAGHVCMEFAPKSVKIDKDGFLFHRNEEVDPSYIAATLIGAASDGKMFDGQSTNLPPADEALLRLLEHERELLSKNGGQQ